MAAFGQLISFCDFIKTHDVEIPRIQRDYTYGSGTEKTEIVIDKLLSDIYSALISDCSNPMILDFVYGSKNENTMYEPLDGQQRLTTLFLLHLFAAWKTGKSTSFLKFKYATRDNTSSFCAAIADDKKFKYNPTGGKVTYQIKDCAFFRSSFYDDPSIASMLVVLDKIEDKFSEMAIASDKNLWDKLTDSNCHVMFYCLDFGTFSEFKLSNDLYIKMNSRGKPLTHYEIFKSQIEKYIEVELQDKEFKYDFAKKFDTDYTDLVWSEQLMKTECIDNSLVQLFANLLSIQNYRKGYTKRIESRKFLGDYLDAVRVMDGKELFATWKIKKEDLEFIIDFLDTFHTVFTEVTVSDNSKESANDILWSKFLYGSADEVGEPVSSGKFARIRTTKTSVNVFRTACNVDLKYAQIIMLYAQYLLLKKYPYKVGMSEEEETVWAGHYNTLRHIRNLVETSDNELSRPDFIGDMLKEVETIINGDILTITSSRFNTTQFLEEKKKASRPDRWEQLYSYENHDILRGALSIFTIERKSFDIDDDDVFSKVIERLRKFVGIFDNDSKKNDRDVRAALLSVHDFTEVSRSDSKYHRDCRLHGVQHASWRWMFVLSENFMQQNLIDALDACPASTPLTIQALQPTDWRYYATQKQYFNHIYHAYSYPQYGYFYFIDAANRPLEAYLLQSTQCSESNVMWKLLNRVLWGRLWATRFNDTDRQISIIGDRRDSSDINIRKQYKIDAVQEGWKLTFKDPTIIYQSLVAKGYSIQNDIVYVPANTDYVEYGLKLTDDIQALLSSPMPTTTNEPIATSE